jgi:dephospho-CoA kinase
VIDAPLLLGSAIENEMDFILVIHASRAIRLFRLLARGMAESDALKRMRTQLPLSELRRRADLVILNNGSLLDLRSKVTAFYKKIH